MTPANQFGTEQEPPAGNDTPASQAKPATSALTRRAQQSAGGRDRAGVEQWLYVSVRDQVAELLQGSPFEVDTYLQAAYRVIEASKDLRAAATESGTTVLGAIMLGATLQLQIGGPLGHYYLTPRNENGRKVCVPMIGYRGFFELGYRSGMIRKFDTIAVRELDDWSGLKANSERGQYFDFAEYADGEFDEFDEKGERRPLRGVVALAHPLGNQPPAFKYMGRRAIELRRPRHWKSTPWNDPVEATREEMYFKTPHRSLAKMLQLSIATARAVEADETISLWNRHSDAIETLRPEQTAPAEVEGADSGAISTEPGQSQDVAPSAGVSPSEPPKAADGRTAPQSTEGIDALDLPAFVRGLGRDMTEAEFERYSAAGGE